jgi:hypothetical protein
VGGPMPESCANFGYQKAYKESINYLKKFKSINFDYAEPIIVPDQFMLNPHHAGKEGAHYFSQKIKPLFDEIQK